MSGHHEELAAAARSQARVAASAAMSSGLRVSRSMRGAGDSGSLSVGARAGGSVSLRARTADGIRCVEVLIDDNQAAALSDWLVDLVAARELARRSSTP